MSVVALVSRPTTKTEVLATEFEKLHHQYVFLYQKPSETGSLNECHRMSTSSGQISGFKQARFLQAIIFALQFFVPALNHLPLAAGWEISDG